MIELLIAKVKTVESTKIKIQIFKLAPTNWSHKKVMNVFGVSEHIVCKACKLCSERGILADVAQLVETF